MRYFSTFSGIGGFELGIEQAYEHHISLRTRKTQTRKGGSIAHKQELVAKRSGSQFSGDSANINGFSKELLDISRPECIGYSEIDSFACSVYRKHFPFHINYGDITTINPKTLPDFDLFVGGFPCQSFSMSGKRGGFQDPRGTLFFEIARIIRQKQPRLLLLENVKGLLSHDEGKTFATILTTLQELGYSLEWQVLNSKHFGVPQNRERVYIIGHLGKKSIRQIFPLYQTERLDSQSNATQKEVCAGTLTARQFANWNGNYVRSIMGDIRRLIPVECERLQGFPDGWTKTGVKDNGKEVELSDNQRYKTLGNAVTVNVIKVIVQAILG